MGKERGKVTTFTAVELTNVAATLRKTANTIDKAVDGISPQGELPIVDVSGVKDCVETIAKFGGKVTTAADMLPMAPVPKPTPDPKPPKGIRPVSDSPKK